MSRQADINFLVTRLEALEANVKTLQEVNNQGGDGISNDDEQKGIVLEGVGSIAIKRFRCVKLTSSGGAGGEIDVTYLTKDDDITDTDNPVYWGISLNDAAVGGRVKVFAGGDESIIEIVTNGGGYADLFKVGEDLFINGSDGRVGDADHANAGTEKMFVALESENSDYKYLRVKFADRGGGGGGVWVRFDFT